MYQFIFEGNQDGFLIFEKAVNEKCPDAGFELEFVDGGEFHCNVKADFDVIFKVGIIISICYQRLDDDKRLGVKDYARKLHIDLASKFAEVVRANPNEDVRKRKSVKDMFTTMDVLKSHYLEK